MKELIFAGGEEIKRAGEQLKQTSPAYAPMIDFYLELFLAQEASREKLVKESMLQDPDIVNSHNRHDMPLMDSSGFAVEHSEAWNLMGVLCGLAVEKAPKLTESALVLKKAMDEKRVDMNTLFPAILKGDDAEVSRLADSLGLPDQDLAFFAFTAMAPSIRTGGHLACKHLDKDDTWAKGYCPVCGNLPTMAFLDQDGKKNLVCGFCMHSWPTRRMGCVFCDSKEKNTYFYSEEEKAYRVDLCDQCKRYLKLVDLRELPRAFYPPLEQLCTLHLDMQAIEQGYTEGTSEAEKVLD